MPSRLHPIDSFLRDFARWYRADRVDVLGDMRVRLQAMLSDAEQRGINRERAVPSGKPIICRKCGSSAWSQLLESTNELIPESGRERDAAFVRSLDDE